jgi:hypothetical protein
MNEQPNYADDRQLRNALGGPYDWTKTTEENFAGNYTNIGKYKHLRQNLDRTFHQTYSYVRQEFQDRIINYYVNLNSAWNRPKWTHTSRTRATPPKPTPHNDHHNQPQPPSTPRPFVLFTAGAMGAGKSHTLRWLARTKPNYYFPLAGAVFVDIDRVREHFPEMDEYRRRWAPTCGTLTHKEAGMICELIWMAALENHQSVIIDSSLRDLAWWRQVIASVRAGYPSYDIGLLHVVADALVVFKRAAKRGRATGRIIPFDTLISSMRQTPVSVRALRGSVDFFLRYDLNGREPTLVVRESNTRNAKDLPISKL